MDYWASSDDHQRLHLALSSNPIDPFVPTMTTCHTQGLLPGTLVTNQVRAIHFFFFFFLFSTIVDKNFLKQSEALHCNATCSVKLSLTICQLIWMMPCVFSSCPECLLPSALPHYTVIMDWPVPPSIRLWDWALWHIRCVRGYQVLNIFSLKQYCKWKKMRI